MQIFINDIEYTGYVRFPSIQMDDKVSDPVPTLQFDMEDPNQAFSFLPWQPVVVLEDTQPASPTHNIYVDPMYTTQTNVSRDTAHETITYNTAAGSATFVVTTHSTPTATLSQTQTVKVNPSQTYTFSISRNISSITNCTVFITTTVLKADGSSASAATDTFTTTSGGTVRYSKTVTLPSTARFLGVTYGVQSIISTSACNTVFSHAQIEMQRSGQGISYPTPDCVPGATSCTQLPDLSTVRETRLWAGYLIIPTVTYFGRERLWSMQCSGTAIMLSKQIVTSYNYNNTDDGTAVLSLVSTALGGLILATTSTVASSGYTFTLFSGNNAYAKDVLDALSKQTGLTYWVDPYGYLYYQLAGGAASFSLSDTPNNVTSFPYYAYSYELDASQMANQMSVLEPPVHLTSTQTFFGTGAQTSFQFSFTPTSIQSVTINGTATTAYTAYLDIGWIVFNSPPANGSTIVVTGTYVYVTAINFLDGASIGTYGVTLMSQYQDSNSTTYDQLAARAQTELASYSTPQAIITLTANQAIKAGQTVSLTSAADSITNATLLVQEVQTTLLGTNEFGAQVREYTCTLGDYRADFIHQLLYVQRVTANQGTDITAQFTFPVELLSEPAIACTDTLSVAVTTTPNLQGRDNFATRSVFGSLGTASDGQSWTTNQSSGSPGISVGSSEGNVIASGSSSLAEFLLGSHTVANVDASIRFAVSIPASSGGTATFSLLGRAVNNSNRYVGQLSVTEGGSSTLALKKTVSGSTSTLSSTTVGYVIGSFFPSFWWMRLHVSGSTLSLKAWQDGLLEPASYQLSTTDTAISSAAKFGCVCTLPGDFSSNIEIDNYIVLGV